MNSKLSEMMQTLKADPKKTGTLAVLGAVLAVMVGRMVMSSGGKSVPSSAAAAVSAPGTAAGSTNATPAQQAVNRSVLAAMQKWSDAPVPPVSRNLFAVRIEYFPVDGSRTTPTPQSDDGFWQRLEKSMAVQADQRDKRDNMIANFKDEAAKLKLESTMMGPQPKALVSGELVGEGSVVAKFRIAKIEARRIIIEREGIRLEIQMK
jgi:hypothetical protein